MPGVDSKEALLTLATKLLGTDYLRIVKDPGGTPLSQNVLAAVVKVTQIEGLQLTWNSATSITVGVGLCIAENGDVINVTSALVKSSLSLSASTWYHVYVYLSGGAPAAEVVTTAPVAWKVTAYSKSGDTSRRYVGSILSDGSGNVRNFIHNIFMNAIYYKKFQINTSPFRALTTGTASTATAVSLTSIIPVTATLPYLRIVTSGNVLLYTGDDNAVSSTQMTTVGQVGTTVIQTIELFHPIDASQQIWYRYDSAVGSGGCNIDIAGYVFNR